MLWCYLLLHSYLYSFQKDWKIFKKIKYFKKITQAITHYNMERRKGENGHLVLLCSEGK